MAVVDSTIPQIVKADQAKKVATTDKRQANKDLQKTRLCVYNLQGKCGYGSNCTFAHSAFDIKNVPDLRKTQLCTKFAEGKCTNKNCTYAHGESELKDPPNFKKKICKWHQKGNCRNGASCGFAHDMKELRADAPPGFETVQAKANVKKLQTVAPPPGLTQMGVEEYDCDASTGAPSSHSQAESDVSMSVPAMPEEHVFRMMAGRGSAPLQHQVTLMHSAIGGLQDKLSQLEDMMLQKQVVQMQQQIEQLSEQCWSLESGLIMGNVPQVPPVAPTSLRSRLNSKAIPFQPPAWQSDDSTSVGSD